MMSWIWLPSCARAGQTIIWIEHLIETMVKSTNG
jgi:hypothetical protein